MGDRPNLVYTCKGYTPRWGWHMVKEKVEQVDREGRPVWSKNGRPYRKTYLSGGQNPSNLWDDVPATRGTEHMGYATTKPLALLQRQIQRRRRCFRSIPWVRNNHGSDTQRKATLDWNRRGHSCDEAGGSHETRRTVWVAGRPNFLIEGVPSTIESAHNLGDRDTYHFRKRTEEQADGFPPLLNPKHSVPPSRRE